MDAREILNIDARVDFDRKMKSVVSRCNDIISFRENKLLDSIKYKRGCVYCNDRMIIDMRSLRGNRMLTLKINKIDYQALKGMIITCYYSRRPYVRGRLKRYSKYLAG